MNPFSTLQKQAARKRDAVILRARNEYRDTCQRIANLRDTLGEPGSPPKPEKLKPIIDLMQELIPRDRTFTFADMLNWLRDAEPDRVFFDPSIRSMLAVLDKRGVLRRVSTNQQGRVLWAAADAEIEESPFGRAALVDVAEAMLQKHGPLKPAELVVAIRETWVSARRRSSRDDAPVVAAVHQAVQTRGRWALGAIPRRPCLKRASPRLPLRLAIHDAGLRAAICHSPGSW